MDRRIRCFKFEFNKFINPFLCVMEISKQIQKERGERERDITSVEHMLSMLEDCAGSYALNYFLSITGNDF